MDRISSWVHFRPWLVPAFLLGMVAGVGLIILLKAIPLTQDGIANIVGAALGAGAAVIASAWVANGAERRKERAAREAVANSVRTTELHVAALIEALSALHEQSDRGACELVTREASLLSDACNLMRDRVDGLEPVFLSLGAWGVASRLELLRRIPYLRDSATQAHYMGTYPSTANRAARLRLVASLRNEAAAILGGVGLRFRGSS